MLSLLLLSKLIEDLRNFPPDFTKTMFDFQKLQQRSPGRNCVHLIFEDHKLLQITLFISNQLDYLGLNKSLERFLIVWSTNEFFHDIFYLFELVIKVIVLND